MCLCFQPQVESARLLQYQEDVRKKDEEIAKLKEYAKKLKVFKIKIFINEGKFLNVER